MDEVRLWNTVRSQTDLQANMNKELLAMKTGLTAYYNLIKALLMVVIQVLQHFR